MGNKTCCSSKQCEDEAKSKLKPELNQKVKKKSIIDLRGGGEEMSKSLKTDS